MIKKQAVAEVKKLCQEFNDDLQLLFDEMNLDTYEDSDAVQTAVAAQAYAEDAARCDS